jgi:hypothetical protein
MTIHPSTADQDDQNIRITCEAELFCDMPSDCPEPLFDWQFNDRPIRSLSNGQGLRIQAIESESRYKRHPSVIQTSQIQASQISLSKIIDKTLFRSPQTFLKTM